jgi:hypothetical protein
MSGKLASQVDAVPRNDPATCRRVDQDALLTDRVTAPEPHMDAGQHVVLVAVNQRHPMLDRRAKRCAKVVWVDDCGEMAETLG